MTDVGPYPFRTDSYMRVKVWGGRSLPDDFGKEAPEGEPIGEAWEVADLDEGESRVATGPLAGETLSELVERWGEALIGTEAPGEDFPLLVKLLDAAGDLSVQVHPSEDDLDDLPGAASKDECWIILAAEEEGSILHGVESGVTASAFRRAVDDGRAASLLRRVDVEPGDVVRVEPGTIHAICSGVTLLEIQQPSDTTYRVYDYNRPGLDGEPRELHLDEAMKVANFGDQPPTSLRGEPTRFEGADVEVLVDVPAYRIERVRLERPVDWRIDPSTPQVLFVVQGRLRVQSPQGTLLEETHFELGPGQTAVLPASIERIGVDPLTEETTEVVVAGLGGRPLVRG